jgi:sigma-B regulation protein RsbU (phosphoserine phosphatase)
MMLRAFLVDDEPPARARLRQLLADAGDVLVVGEAGDANEAWSAIAETRPDVIFLDIDMPERSGTALAAALPSPRPFIVFATAYDRYALDAFAVDATDYLLKPISRQRLSGTLQRVRDRMSTRSELERELLAASAVQARLLPRILPAVEGYTCAAATLPARGVGGDFYLAQPIAGNRIGFALGDVSGKGLSAGLVASSLQARLETMALYASSDPADIVRDVNAALCAATDTARFATLAYLELDFDRHTMQIVNAGHLPVIAVAPDGSHRLFSSTGPAIGMWPTATFDPISTGLSPGTVVVAYSDGLTEALNDDDDEYGAAQLIHEIARGRALSAEESSRRLIESVDAHRGTRPADDDITVLVIKRTDH